jgi:hypothetical protein
VYGLSGLNSHRNQMARVFVAEAPPQCCRHPKHAADSWGSLEELAFAFNRRIPRAVGGLVFRHLSEPTVATTPGTRAGVNPRRQQRVDRVVRVKEPVSQEILLYI